MARLRKARGIWDSFVLHVDFQVPPCLTFTAVTILNSRHLSHYHCDVCGIQGDYLMALKKLSSLIALLLLFLMAFVSSSLACPASSAPSNVPSPPGRSMLCSYNGTLGASASGLSSCCLRSALAASRLCFFDFAM